MRTGRRQRGLYVYNRYIITLTRHHKAKWSTNREVFIVRYLPARAGRILYYYLVYIRPFVDMLERGNRSRHLSVDPQSKSTLLFRSDQMPYRPWNLARLTAILKTATSRVLGWPVTTQLYRQLSIAITEKDVQEVHKPFNRHNDKGSGADPNVAFAWQSGHRPLQWTTTYGLDDAFPSQLQPSLLRVYEHVSKRWHEFIDQPSKRMPPGRDLGRVSSAKQAQPGNKLGAPNKDERPHSDRRKTSAVPWALPARVTPLAPLTKGPGPGQCVSVSLSTDGQCQSPGQVVSSTSHSDTTKKREQPEVGTSAAPPTQSAASNSRPQGPTGDERMRPAKAKDVAVALAEPRWCSIGCRADPRCSRRGQRTQSHGGEKSKVVNVVNGLGNFLGISPGRRCGEERVRSYSRRP